MTWTNAVPKVSTDPRGSWGFDQNGDAVAFSSEIQKMMTELESKSQRNFKTQQDYISWRNDVLAKYSHVFDRSHMQVYNGVNNLNAVSKPVSKTPPPAPTGA